MRKNSRGFTLVELIVVMVITGILAGILVSFFSPAISNYFATSRRAAMTDVADGAMRRMVRDVRSSVSNSVRTLTGTGTTCLETIPTSSGGRYRTAPDTSTTTSKAAEPGFTVSEFDILTSTTARANDWVVIGNQDSEQVHIGSNRGVVSSIGSSATGVRRITLSSNLTVPAGYDGARFVIVPGSEGPVAYVCEGVGTDAATGTGKGVLYRVSNYGFGATSCPATAATGKVVAKHISSCTFRYDPNPGATQESGYAEVDLTLTESKELVRLFFGVHVDNIP